MTHRKHLPRPGRQGPYEVRGVGAVFSLPPPGLWVEERTPDGPDRLCEEGVPVPPDVLPLPRPARRLRKADTRVFEESLRAKTTTPHSTVTTVRSRTRAMRPR